MPDSPLAVINVILRFERSFDEKDWKSMRRCLWAEVATDYSRTFRASPPQTMSAEAYVDSRKKALSDVRTGHLTSNHEVDFNGDEALCRCDFTVRRWLGERFFHSYGWYRFQLRRRGSGWRISGITQVEERTEGDPAIHGGSPLRRE